MKRCTYSHMRTGNCSERASVRLSWSRSITQGWDVSVTRVYCPEHAGKVLTGLNSIGTPVTVEDLAAERAPVVFARA